MNPVPCKPLPVTQLTRPPSATGLSRRVVYSMQRVACGGADGVESGAGGDESCGRDENCGGDGVGADESCDGVESGADEDESSVV